jgi:hypothetical protein
VLAAIAALARSLGIRWYLFGAQAAVIWGRARTTADVDVTLELGLDEVPALLRRASAHHLRAREPAAAELARTARVVPLISDAGMPVDVVLAGTGLEARFLNRAQRVRVGALDVPVISPEDLIITKVIAGRPRDLEDVRGVVAERHAALDRAYIEETLRDVELGLELDGLLARWRGALGSA